MSELAPSGSINCACHLISAYRLNIAIIWLATHMEMSSTPHCFICTHTHTHTLQLPSMIRYNNNNHKIIDFTFTFSHQFCPFLAPIFFPFFCHDNWMQSDRNKLWNKQKCKGNALQHPEFVQQIWKLLHFIWHHISVTISNSSQYRHFVQKFYHISSRNISISWIFWSK